MRPVLITGTQQHTKSLALNEKAACIVLYAQAATTHSGAMTTHLLNLADLEAGDWRQFRHERKLCPPSAKVVPFFAPLEWQWQTLSAGVVLLDGFLQARALLGKPVKFFSGSTDKDN